MEFSKICAPTLKELFVQELEKQILSGKLEIGAKLPAERELSEMMQVSRAVVNGGIVELAQKGFLTIKPRIGTFVADYRRNGTIETLLAIMNYNGGILRRAEIKSILEIRLALDTLAVRLVIPKISGSELELLKKYVEDLKYAENGTKAAEIAFGFHHELGMISGNTLLPLIFYSFKFPIISLWERFWRMYGAQSLYRNTEELYRCIEKKDTAGAIASISRTISDTIDGNRQIYFD